MKLTKKQLLALAAALFINSQMPYKALANEANTACKTQDCPESEVAGDILDDATEVSSEEIDKINATIEEAKKEVVAQEAPINGTRLCSLAAEEAPEGMVSVPVTKEPDAISNSDLKMPAEQDKSFQEYIHGITDDARALKNIDYDRLSINEIKELINAKASAFIADLEIFTSKTDLALSQIRESFIRMDQTIRDQQEANKTFVDAKSADALKIKSLEDEILKVTLERDAAEIEVKNLKEQMTRSKTNGFVKRFVK